MARYRSWDLDTDRGLGWWTRAACQGQARMFFTCNSALAAQAAHLCLAHCPVLVECGREAAEHPPVGAVQAGIWYADGNSSKAGPRHHQPPTLCCGPWCAHLRPPIGAPPMTDQPHLNGTRPAAPNPAEQTQALEAFAFANYQVIARPLGAINVLLATIPLEALLVACKRHQNTSVLTLPAGVPVEKPQAAARGVRGDGKVTPAASNRPRVVAAVSAGGA